MSRFLNFLRSKKGAAMVEYALLVAGIAIVAVAAVSILGHKTSDLIATSATIIPGVDELDNQPIASGRLIETDQLGPGGEITVDIPDIVANSGTQRMGANIGDTSAVLDTLVVPINP
jgi:pilus assembly protein Flp/PilA